MSSVLSAMTLAGLALAFCALIAGAAPDDGRGASTKTVRSIYDFTVKTIDGEEAALSRYRGDVLLIVNVASR